MSVTTKSGRVLTEEDLDQLADRLEKGGPDPDRLIPRKPGRPPLGEDYPAPRIQVRVPRQLYRAVNERARDEGTTVSALVRRLLEKYAASSRR